VCRSAQAEVNQEEVKGFFNGIDPSTSDKIKRVSKNRKKVILPLLVMGNTTFTQFFSGSFPSKVVF